MLRLTHAELYKALRRPAFWVLFAVLAVAMALFGYAAPYLFLRRAPGLDGESYDRMLADLLPGQLPVASLTGLAEWGGPVALLLGALVAGSEYSWRTLPMLVLHGRGRAAVVHAQLLVTAVSSVALSVVATGAGGASSLLVGRASGAPVTGLSVPALVGTVLAGALMLAMWSWVGLVLAHVLRSPTTSIGLGLVYLLLVEGLIQALPAADSWVAGARRWLPGANSRAVAGLFGELAVGGPGRSGIDPVSATFVVAGYGAVMVLVAVVCFRSRESA